MTDLQTSTAPALTIRRTFAAPRARVFAAWTDVAIFQQWFPPQGRLTSVNWEPRQGNTYRVAFTVESGEEWAVVGVFSEVRAPERLAFTFRWKEDDPALERDTFVSVELFDRGHETEMLFTHAGFRDDVSSANHDKGWNMSFDSLASTLS